MADQLPEGFVPDGFVPDAPAPAANFSAQNARDEQGRIMVNGQPVDLNDSPFARAAMEFYNKGPIGGTVGLAKGVGNAVGLTGNGFHPVDALTEAIGNVLKTHWDEAVKAGQKAKSAGSRAVNGPWNNENASAANLYAIEAIGHGLAAILPAIGPLAEDSGQHGAKGDIAGAIGGALGLLSPFAAKYGLESRATSAPKLGKADLLRREAEQQVSQNVLAPGNPRYKGTAAAVAPEILDRKLQGGRLELQQMADEGMDAAAQKIDAAINNSGGRQAPIPTKPILAAIDRSLDDLSTTHPATGAVSPIPTAEGRFKTLTKLRDYISKFGPDVPFEQLQKVRDDFYGEAAKKGGYERAGNVQLADGAWAAREAGSAIRQGLTDAMPETAPHNAEYSFWKNLDAVLDPAMGRPKTGTATTGVTGGLHTTGAIIGQALASGPLAKIPGMGAAGALVVSKLLPMIREAQASPAWQLASAAKKADLAEAIKAGNIGKAQSLLLNIAKIAPVAGVFNPALPASAFALRNAPTAPTTAGGRR